jgi:hypothetical protein
MFEAFRAVAASILLLAPVPFTTAVQVDRFSSIELPKGGHVILRPSATQRVTLVRGSLDYTRVSVTERGALVIDKCFRKCPRGYRLEVEILSPNVRRLSLANGGRIESRGSFARQSDLAVAVAHGGTIDVRSIVARSVTATVEQGGRILTVPQASLVASVSHGGVITFWGDAQVTSSIEHGGVVNKGTTAEMDLPLSEIGLPVLSHRTKGGR